MSDKTDTKRTRPRDWSEIPKGATREAVARPRLQPWKRLPPKRV